MLRQNLVQGCVKLGPSMLRNKIGPTFDAKKCFFPFLLVFLKNLIFPAERRGFLKIKTRKNRENLDQVLTQKKAIFGPSFDATAYICIINTLFQSICTCVYAYICELRDIGGAEIERDSYEIRCLWLGSAWRDGRDPQLDPPGSVRSASIAGGLRRLPPSDVIGNSLHLSIILCFLCFPPSCASLSLATFCCPALPFGNPYAEPTADLVSEAIASWNQMSDHPTPLQTPLQGLEITKEGQTSKRTSTKPIYTRSRPTQSQQSSSRAQVESSQSGWHWAWPMWAVSPSIFGA